VDLIDVLSGLFWSPVERLARRYPVLVGVPLMLLPVFIFAGAIYLIKISY
jgi:hypothetical protein